MAAGKLDVGHVAHDALDQLRARATALLKGCEPEVAAAIAAIVDRAEAKAQALSASVAAGKSAPDTAVDQVVAAMEAALKEVQEALAAAGVQGTTKGLAGEEGGGAKVACRWAQGSSHARLAAASGVCTAASFQLSTGRS